MIFNVEQIEQAKQIADLMSALGKALENSSNAQAKALGEVLSQTGDLEGVLSDMAKLEGSSSDFQQLLDSATEVAAEMLGGSVGAAALESFIIGNVSRALVVGALVTSFPVLGTLGLAASFLGAAWIGGQAAGGAYRWAKDAAEMLSTQLPSGPVDLGDNFDPSQYPDAVILDITEINAEFDGYPLEKGTQQYLTNSSRLEDRDFILQMQREINEFNYSLSSFIKPGDGFLYKDSNGMLGWDGGYSALQSYGLDNAGLDIWSGPISWQSQFNQKFQRVMDAGNDMQAFIDSNFGRANKVLGGQATAVSSKASEITTTADEAFAEMTPLALDLSGNGINTRSIFDGIKGFEFVPGEKGAYHGWLDQDSGFLALDRNDNGVIDDGSELFGSPTEDGFVALRRLDSNKDGRIDAADELFQKLLVWQDTNQNTTSEPGELMSLHEAGIQSISLGQVESVYRPDKNGNTIKWISEYTTESGETREIADVYFRYSKPASALSKQVTTDTTHPALEQQTLQLIDSMAAFNPPQSSATLMPVNNAEPVNVPLAVN